MDASVKKPKSTKIDRRAAALRENLKKRKVQDKSRKTAQKDPA